MPSPHAPIGVIGLGLMGSVLTGRLLAAGFTVLAHDIDLAKCHAAAAMGAGLASPEQMARDCEQVVLALFDTVQVEDIVRGALASSGRALVVICTSTCDPDRIAILAASCAPLRFLEAPVSGTSDQVRRGEGVALLGGDAALVADAAPVLDALFATRHLVGGSGDGGRAKLAVNLVLGVNRLALAEGLVLAECLGLDLAAFLPVLRASAAYSQVMDTKGAKMVSGDFTPQGKIAQSAKDFALIRDLAGRVGQPLPAAALNLSVLQASIDAGDGERDNAAVVAELRRRRVPASRAARTMEE